MSVLTFLLLLLSLGVHNHVDDYSGTFGTVTAQARDTSVYSRRLYCILGERVPVPDGAG